MSQSLIFDFPFVRPYKVTFLGIFYQKGLIKYYFVYKMIHISEMNYLNSDAVVSIMSTDFRLDTNGRDPGFNTFFMEMYQI